MNVLGVLVDIRIRWSVPKSRSACRARLHAGLDRRPLPPIAPVAVPEMVAASLTPLMVIGEGLIGRERAVRHRDSEAFGRRSRQRIDRVSLPGIVGVRAGRAVDEKRAVETGCRIAIGMSSRRFTEAPAVPPLML